MINPISNSEIISAVYADMVKKNEKKKHPSEITPEMVRRQAEWDYLNLVEEWTEQRFYMAMDLGADIRLKWDHIVHLLERDMPDWLLYNVDTEENSWLVYVICQWNWIVSTNLGMVEPAPILGDVIECMNGVELELVQKPLI